MLLYLQIGFNYVRAAMACAVLETSDAWEEGGRVWNKTLPPTFEVGRGGVKSS